MQNIPFYPSPRGNTYISVNYHQKNGGGRSGKSRWDIEPQEEFDLFCQADIPDCPEKDDCQEKYTCPKVNECPKKRNRRWKSGDYLYSFRNGAKDIIGKKNERLARFEGNDQLREWHGYPILKPIISNDLINYWWENNIISESTKRKLQRFKI